MIVVCNYQPVVRITLLLSRRPVPYCETEDAVIPAKLRGQKTAVLYTRPRNYYYEIFVAVAERLQGGLFSVPASINNPSYYLVAFRGSTLHADQKVVS